MGRPGLVQKKVNVRTKKGVVRRTMWVKSQQASGMKARKGSALGFLQKHKGKIAGAAALAGAAYLAHKHGKGIKGAISGALGGARLGHAMVKEHGRDAGGKTRMVDRARGAIAGAAQGVANNTKFGAEIRDIREHNAKVRSSLEGMARQYGTSTAPKSLGSRIRSRFSRKSS